MSRIVVILSEARDDIFVYRLSSKTKVGTKCLT